MSKNRHTIKVGSSLVKYRQIGSGPTLLYLHGLGQGPETTPEFLEQMAKKYEVIAPSMYGINYLKPQPKTVEEYLNKTCEFVNTLQLGTHYLAGYSVGAGIAMRYATLSDLPQKIGLISPMLPFNHFSVRISGQAIDFISNNKKNILKLLISQFGNFSATKSMVQDVLRKTLEDVLVEQPTIILHGTYDEFFTLDEQNKNRLPNHFKDYTLDMVPDIGHVLIMDRPEYVTDKLKNFLK